MPQISLRSPWTTATRRNSANFCPGNSPYSRPPPVLFTPRPTQTPSICLWRPRPLEEWVRSMDNTQPIRVLAWAQEIYWADLHDPILADLVLAGKIQANPSWQTIWWLDENLCQHSVDGPMDMERPRLEV